VVLETVLLRCHHVPTLVLSDFDLPLPGGGGGAGVDVDVDLIALRRGGDEHMLASVVSTDGGRGHSPRVADGQTVHCTVSHRDAVGQHRCCRYWRGHSRGGCQHHRVEVYPQLTDVRVGLAECVGAGVLVCAGGVGGDDGVGVVGAAATPAGDREDTANSEG